MGLHFTRSRLPLVLTVVSHVEHTHSFITPLCVDAKDVKFIMIYYSSCQHIYKITEEYKEMHTTGSCRSKKIEKKQDLNIPNKSVFSFLGQLTTWHSRIC